MNMHELLDEFDRRCTYCGTHVTCNPLSEAQSTLATREHLVPRSRGGGNARANLALSCLSCNNTKGDMTDGEFRHLATEGALHPTYVAWVLAQKLRRFGKRRRRVALHTQRGSGA